MKAKSVCIPLRMSTEIWRLGERHDFKPIIFIFNSIFVKERVPYNSYEPALKSLVKNCCVKDRKIKGLEGCVVP